MQINGGIFYDIGGNFNILRNDNAMDRGVDGAVLELRSNEPAADLVGLERTDRRGGDTRIVPYSSAPTNILGRRCPAFPPKVTVGANLLLTQSRRDAPKTTIHGGTFIGRNVNHIQRYGEMVGFIGNTTKPWPWLPPWPSTSVLEHLVKK
ncbi:hypothetical protein C8R44DRAFT_749965 [Mycena epipterygia]|nr:hypothetical protein C8R44DRAFT_749965 [Mycena epipterygia]